MVTVAIIKGVMNMTGAAVIRNSQGIACCRFCITLDAKAMEGILRASKNTDHLTVHTLSGQLIDDPYF